MLFVASLFEDYFTCLRISAPRRKMSQFSGLEVAAPIEVFQVNKMCTDDPNPDKVNMSIGAYRTNEGKPWVLPVVREAERLLAADESQNHEYLPILGFGPFSQAAAELVLGTDSPPLKDGRAVAVQCLSGTGSLRLASEFLYEIAGYKSVLVSKPTWGNHNLIFKNVGYTNIGAYRYWDQANRCIDFKGYLEDLENAPEKTVVILHGCAHNPTGSDPTKEQWQQVLEVVKRKKLFPLMDIAYQGFASGNPDEDAWAVRHFAASGIEMMVAQSFAKNFGLYNERIGNLVFVVGEAKVVEAVKSRLSLLVRANYSNPPNHGAKIVHMILTTPAMRQSWQECIASMSGRIKEMRAALRSKLEELKTPGDWSHITTQIGMFSFTGLNEAQCKLMVEKHHVYLLKSGRVNMCGLNTGNVERVAKAIDDVVRNA